MRILVTGADGFVGSRLVPKLSAAGHQVGAGILPDGPTGEQMLRRQRLESAQPKELDLLDSKSVDTVVAEGWDAIVHLAAVSSGAEASRDPISAWNVNTLGTVRLMNALGYLRAAGADPLLLFVSTAEVYGAGRPIARAETDDVRPCSTYAASKLAAEIAVEESALRCGLRSIIARPFQHTGPGQDARFVVPAFARRLRDAKRRNASSVAVGNLDPVRDFLHVDDVVEAYMLLLEFGTPGEVYNIASGIGVSVRDVLHMVMSAMDYPVRPELDQDLIRQVDVPHLVGSTEKLHIATGWRPQLSLEQAIQEVVDAQTD